MSIDPMERILSRVKNVQRRGDGYVASCPCADHGRRRGDRNPSLLINHGDDGRVLLNCRVGCSFEAIIEALGLGKADMFAGVPSNGNGKAHKPSSAGKLKPATNGSKPKGKPYPSANDAVKAKERQRGRKRDALWVYHNAEGKPVGLAVRFNKPDGDKDVLPFSAHPDGWRDKAMPEPRPLYRLPQVLASEGRVYVAEGEKAADALVGLGLNATTSPGGCNAAHKADWSALTNREVVISPDVGDDGAKYAQQVASILSGSAASVKVVELPGLAHDGDDAVEYVAYRREQGWSDGDMRAEVEALADAAEAWEPPAGPEPSDTPPGPEPYRHFPVDVLPEPVKGFVESTSDAMGCDASFLALPLLSTLASAIGNTRRIRLKRTWSEPPILWTTIIGESGTLKSPAMEAALAPVREADRRAGKEYEEAMERYEKQQLAYECDLKRWKGDRSRKSGGDDAGEPPEPPEKPAMVRHDVEDTTAEALAPILLDNWRGVLLARDELAGWLNSFNQYKGGKGGDVAAWLNFHGGRPAKVDRKSGHPPTIRIPRAAVSVTGGIQPGTLKRAMGFERFEDGLAARLLLAMPPTPVKRWTEAEGDAHAEQRLREVFDRLYALEPGRDAEGELQPVLTPMTAEGKRTWVQFFDEHNAELVELGGDLRAAWAKLEGYAARLALLVHFIRWAADDPTLADPDAVDGQSMEAGITLARWFRCEARRVYAVLGESDEDAERRKLIELIQRKGSRITPRQLQQSSRQYRTANDAKAALSKLVECGLGTWEVVGTATKQRHEFHLLTPSTSTDLPETREMRESVDSRRVDGPENGESVDDPNFPSHHDVTPAAGSGDAHGVPLPSDPSLDDLNALAADARDADDPDALVLTSEDETALNDGHLDAQPPADGGDGRERGTL